MIQIPYPFISNNKNTFNDTLSGMQKPVGYNMPMPVGPAENYENLLKPLSSDLFQKMPETILENKPKTIVFGKENLSDETFEEAKRIVVDTILSEKPAESVVYIQNDEIVRKFLGDAKRCIVDDDLDDISSFENPLIVVHSHPRCLSGMTFPVSVGDFETLCMSPGVRSVYAINSDGEFSVLRKKTSKTIDTSEVRNLEDLYWFELINCLSVFDDKKCKKAVEIFNEIQKLSDFDIKKDELLKEFNAMLRGEIQGYTACFTHRFWQRHAEKLGLEYETNFSAFQDE